MGRWSRLVLPVALALAVSCSGSLAALGEEYLRQPAGFAGLKYDLSGGDGDQDYLGEPLPAVVVEEPWFTGEILGFGPALLTRVTDGRHAGEYIAVTGLDERAQFLLSHGYATVVAHKVLVAGADFRGRRDQVNSIGKTVIQRVDDKGQPMIAPPTLYDRIAIMLMLYRIRQEQQTK